MKNYQVRTARYVVGDGVRYLSHDSGSGYPWVSDSISTATVYKEIEKAIKGADDFIGDYCRMPVVNIYQLVLESVDVGPDIENIQRRRREQELSRIKQNVAKLRPEDIEYIKKNM